MAGAVRTTFPEQVTGQWIRILCHSNTGCGSIDELRIFGADPSFLSTTVTTTQPGASASTTPSTSEGATTITTEGSTTSTSAATTGSRPAAVNLALNKPALASTGLFQTRAVDGSLTTQWSSLPGDQTPWLWVDLRGRHDVSEVVISWASEFPAEFRLEAGYSAAHWTPVITAAGQANSEVRVVFNPVNLQFLRVLCTDLGSSSGCSIRELEVFNSGPPETTSTSSTTQSTSAATTGSSSVTVEATTTGTTTTPNSTDPGSENTSTSTMTVTTTLAPNVAERKPIRASSQRSPTEYAARANDGDESTRWASGGGPTEWILIDLLGSYVLHGGVVLWGDAVPASYGLEVSSDGVNWAPVFDEMEPSADYRNYHNLPSIIGQWLKLTCHNEDTAGCSMKEVLVHGIPAADVSLAELEELAQRTSFASRVFPSACLAFMLLKMIV